MTDKQPKFRSPPFPYIGLGKALEKTDQLYGAVRHHAAALPTAAKAWDTGPKSSATLQSVAALIQYGLLEDEGSGDARKVKLSPLALKIVMDKRPGSIDRAAALKEAALNPKTFAEIHEQFGAATDIDDALLTHALTAERVQQGRAPYSEQSASDVIRVYKDAISFAGISDIGKKHDEPSVSDGIEQVPNSADRRINIGEYVQWISNGVAQFEEPRRVRATSNDEQWAFVDGSETGIHMSELEPLKAPASKARAVPPKMALPEDDPTVEFRVDPKERNRMKVAWEGKLIHISATVDKDGLARLRQKLDAMETLIEDD